jgi:hypothetical protein
MLRLMLMCQDIKDGGIFLCRVGVSVVMVVVVLVMLECCGRVVHVETIDETRNSA